MNTPVKYIDTNKYRHVYVVGDVHGCYNQLVGKLRVMQFDKQQDLLVSVGDLVDRGPDSMSCLQLLYEPWFECVYANHESMMVNSLLENIDISLWYINGGNWYHQLDYDEARLVELICKEKIGTWDKAILPFVIILNHEDGSCDAVVHAEFPWKSKVQMEEDMSRQNSILTERQKTNLTWARTRWTNKDTTPIEGFKTVYVGHSIVHTPRWLGNVRMIDIGAGKISECLHIEKVK